MTKNLSKKELEKAYADELARKDALIEELREENTLLLRTALKQSHKR